MSARPPPIARASPTARTRVCPHCKSTILESANVCPGCRHHLKFDSVAARRQAETRTALRIDGTIKGASPAVPCEYSVVIAIRDSEGREVGRHVVGVGAIRPAEEHGFTLAVEVTPTSLEWK
ncbi:MAG TPA: hypothetical protein PK681_07315 [Steroidobacteraceae bacterium]|nr:hypothetical protein [Steroidobacteraceae bacterium]HQW08357.1 hypothetical protein [Steroidobacteraceae bacterium]HQX79673.1 hypothetical protein [Steroidobacteraceae bacterium]HQZ80412.1 hypothetical protein [Steroidobacteraceae bacterium]